jgi:hypothetical protein
MSDILIENILLKEPHSPTATIVPDKHTIISSLPESAGNHSTVIPNPLNRFGRWRQKVGFQIFTTDLLYAHVTKLIDA